MFHVNGDDPEAVALMLPVLAVDYRYTFFHRTNAFIDLVCFRRHGHNEQGGPFLVTQPLMYRKINVLDPGVPWTLCGKAGWRQVT